jgi:hypothetical protein
VFAYAIGLGGCVTILALHVIFAYLRKADRRISAPRARMAAAAPVAIAPAVIDPTDFVDPRVARIISEIPQRRTRAHTYGREFAPAR